jgi:uncharacterized protein (TIGR03435 family)
MPRRRRRKTDVKLLLLLAAFAAAHAQSPAFEVVSIKPAAPDQTSVSSRGGPGVRVPGPWICRNMSLANIVSISYSLRGDQLKAPDWMSEVRFDITAKAPEGATRDQLRPMIQNMLATRFGLQVHREPKQTQGYELIVASGGSKLRAAAPPQEMPPPPPGGFYQTTTFDADGYPVLPPAVPGAWMKAGRGAAQWFGVKLDRLAELLADQVEAPVVNATGLDGAYDITLRWDTQPDRDSSRPGPSIFDAVQKQLGLKLGSKKVTVDVIVVDRAEKVPTEN